MQYLLCPCFYAAYRDLYHSSNLQELLVSCQCWEKLSRGLPPSEKQFWRFFFMWSVTPFTLLWCWSRDGNSSPDTKLEWSESSLFRLAADGLKNLSFRQLSVHKHGTPGTRKDARTFAHHTKRQVSTPQTNAVSRLDVALQPAQHSTSSENVFF